MLARPELAVYIARIAVAWSHAEWRLGLVAVQLLGAHAHTGMKMYQALSGSASRKSVLRAVAKDRLKPDALADLEAILSNYKKVAGQRNNVIHGQWEVSDDHPDALVWSDVSESLDANSEFWAGYHSHADDVAVMAWLKDWRGRERRSLLYEKNDFQDILDRIRDVAGELQEFSLSLHQRKGDKSRLRNG